MSRLLCFSVLPTSLLEHQSMSQSAQAHQHSTHRIQEKCPHAHPSLETTARVSPPRHWEVSIGRHTHQDMAIWMANPRAGADSFSLVLLSPFVTETWIQKMAIICFLRWCRESFRACCHAAPSVRKRYAFLENYSQHFHGNTAIDDNSGKFTFVTAIIFAPTGSRVTLQACMNEHMYA